MRKLFIAGNWKMNKTPAESTTFCGELKAALVGFTDVDVAVCPPYTSLERAQEALKGSAIQVGAQDISNQKQGAFTGEIAVDFIKAMGIPYCIVGHSERRQYHHETNEQVNLKVKKLLESGILPIVCIGETLAERQSGQTLDVVKTQLTGCLKDITKEQMLNITIAYEPVWAIGTGVVATTAQAQEVHAFIRKELTERFDKDTADKLRLQYGGSVKPDNAKELMSQPDIDGALVGGASLKVADFVGIIKA